LQGLRYISYGLNLVQQRHKVRETMSDEPINYKHPIIVRINNRQFKAVSGRFHMCVKHTETDNNGFLVGFVLEIPRKKHILAPERIMFQRTAWLQGNTLTYLIFSPTLQSVTIGDRLAQFLIEASLCSPIQNREERADIYTL
jgi:hypothetical protein